jgi:hypothetical protein
MKAEIGAERPDFRLLRAIASVAITFLRTVLRFSRSWPCAVSLNVRAEPHVDAWISRFFRPFYHADSSAHPLLLDTPGRVIMLLQEGDIILVAHRRLFAKDAARFFLGRVVAYEAGMVKARGHSYVRDMITGNMLEKTEERTKLLALASGTLIVYQLPDSVALDAIRFVSNGRQLTVTDGKAFVMNLAESSLGNRG